MNPLHSIAGFLIAFALIYIGSYVFMWFVARYDQGQIHDYKYPNEMQVRTAKPYQLHRWILNLPSPANAAEQEILCLIVELHASQAREQIN